MKYILKTGTLVFSISVLIMACGSDNSPKATYPYTYNYQDTEDGVVTCTTQPITSYSQINLCKNLLDNQLNNFCAPAKRQVTFEANNCGVVLGIASSNQLHDDSL